MSYITREPNDYVPNQGRTCCVFHAQNGAYARKLANCPAENRPDFDIGAAEILVEAEKGRDLVFTGQKSGMVAAMDPNDKGNLVWKQRVGRGGTMGDRATEKLKHTKSALPR